MKGAHVTTVILHFAHSPFRPYWTHNPNIDMIHQSPSFDAGTVRSRNSNLVAVPPAQRNQYAQYPATIKVNQVKVFNLVNELIYFTRTADYDWAKLAKVKRCCETRTQIMICIHGYERDTDNSYVRRGRNEYAREDPIHFRALAYFIHHLTVDRETPLNILLSRCYGARSRNYLKNHENLAQLTPDDLKSSFAYKFADALVRKKRGLQLRLTARTGALAFNYETGESLVQSEDAILAVHEFRRLRDEIAEIEDTNIHERSISDFMDLKARFAVVRRRADHTPTRRKYGKLVYEFNGQDVVGEFGVKITNKYPQQTLLRE
ncbi:MAG: hypothetical protein JNJ46_04165 [Myxococcales bacterium]|nr:hypothetical protein [Myxococcales bacterium]